MENLKNLLDMLTAIDGVSSASVVSRDGFVLESSMRSRMDVEAVAAVVSSGISSQESIGRELGFGDLDQGLFEFQKGMILTARINTDALLVVTAQPPGHLGRIRYRMKRLFPELAERL